MPPQWAGHAAALSHPTLPGAPRARLTGLTGLGSGFCLPARRLFTTLCFLQSQRIAWSGVFTESMDSSAISSKWSPHSLHPKKVRMYLLMACSTAWGSSSRPAEDTNTVRVRQVTRTEHRARSCADAGHGTARGPAPRGGRSRPPSRGPPQPQRDTDNGAPWRAGGRGAPLRMCSRPGRAHWDRARPGEFSRGTQEPRRPGAPRGWGSHLGTPGLLPGPSCSTSDTHRLGLGQWKAHI